MRTIRLTRHIDSETLHLPELRPLLGRDVEIIVIENGKAAAEEDQFWHNVSLDELAAAQGINAPQPLDRLRGGWTDDDFDGFEEAVAEWRNDGPRS